LVKAYKNTIRNSITEILVCKLSLTSCFSQVYSNNSRIEGNTSTGFGYYEDIFTGECCVPTAIRNSSFDFNNETDKLFVIMYELSISNDGANYGDANPVYIYDTICIEHVEIHDAVTFRLKVIIKYLLFMS
jgi:hypothetical protein